MKIVIAPDSFKESMTALEAATAIETGILKQLPDAECIKIPMADGGEGTVQSLVDATNGHIIYQQVTGPLGKMVEGFYGMTGDGQTAIIEMAAASGLHLVDKEERNPLLTTTRGTGELITAALNKGVQHIIIGLGGSATNDGGAGMAQALGIQLLDVKGNEIGDGGGALADLHTIDMATCDPRLADVTIEVACDVDNPLTGEHGAAAVFGPQKGATQDMVHVLDQNLQHFAATLKRDLALDVTQTSGAGAAGGLGAGVIAFLGAKLKRGVDIIIRATALEAATKGAAVVITGEGKIDSQTHAGKTPMGVAEVARKLNVPVIGIAGMIDQKAIMQQGEEKMLDAIFSIAPGPTSLEDVMAHAKEYTEAIAENIATLMQLKR